MGKHLELYDTFPISVKINKPNTGVILSDSDGVKSDFNLICEIDATHAGTLINNRIYPPEHMRKGIKTWVKPFKKPVLLNHNDHSDPIGRVISAKYIDTELAISNSDYKPILKKSEGYGFQRLTAKISNPEAIQKIIDGRYQTVSVRMSTTMGLCSICDTDWAIDGPCEHTPGTQYDGKLAYITTGALSYSELSFVNIPADEYAGVIDATLLNKDELNSTGINLFAVNTSKKILSDLSEESDNLYLLLEDENGEDDDIVLHLLDKSSKIKKQDKEESVKIEELTKDQLMGLDSVKSLIKEEVDKQQEEIVNKTKTECEDAIRKVQEDCVKNRVAVEDYKKVVTELEQLKEKLGIDNGSSEISIDKKIEKLNRDIQTLEDQLKQKDEDSARILDENIRLNSDLHKSYAERLYDLKLILGKPDVSDIKTPNERDGRIAEFAERSIESLSDQIKDLLIEKEKFGLLSTGIYNPGVGHIDNTNNVSGEGQKKDNSKPGIMKRLFG